MEKGVNDMNHLLGYDDVGRMDDIYVIDSGWVFARKFKDGKFEKYRARLVARGNHQVAGIDYHELHMYSPVMRLESFRIRSQLSLIGKCDSLASQLHIYTGI
jgi:Reverse transcriptase (RNA-dependent DNA polymerase)